jgi:hypothetical protein
LFYCDERAVFFVNPAERVDMVSDYNGYYWNDVFVLAAEKIKVPPLYEAPVKVIKDPIGPVANPLINLANPNFERVMMDNKQFTFGGAAFDARGIANKGVGQ